MRAFGRRDGKKQKQVTVAKVREDEVCASTRFQAARAVRRPPGGGGPVHFVSALAADDKAARPISLLAPRCLPCTGPR